MNNNNLSINISQINNQNNSNERENNNFDKIEYIQNLRGYGQVIFTYLAKSIRYHGKAYISQTTIAAQAGCNLKTVNRWIRKFVEHGLISKLFRLWRTSVYQLSRFLEFQYNCVVGRTGKCPTIVKRSYLLKRIRIRESISVSKQCARVVATCTETICNVFKKRIGRNVSNSNVELPKFVRNIKHLDLTTTGMVYLSGFSEDIIKYADRAIARKRDLECDAYNYFWAICRRKTREQGKEIHWDVINTLKDWYKCKDEDPRTNRDTIINPDPIKIPKRGTPIVYQQKETHIKRAEIYARPYCYGNKISFPTTWTHDMKFEFMDEKWPVGIECPIINDPRIA